jgi:hypothetical protein
VRKRKRKKIEMCHLFITSTFEPKRLISYLLCICKIVLAAIQQHGGAIRWAAPELRETITIQGAALDGLDF